jgi:hypothetical protein
VNDVLFAAIALGDKIERFGSYFGYAAVIGLGVLSLLYFAQAREVKRLREWAGRAPERDAELAQRVRSDAQRRVVAQPAVTGSVAAQPASPQTAAAQQADAARKAAAAAVMEKFQEPGAGPPPVVGPPGSLARPAPGLGGTPGSEPGVVGPPAATGPPAGGAGSAAGPGSPVAGGAPGSVGAGPAGTVTAGAGSSAPTAASAGAAAAAARQAGPPSQSPVTTNGAGGQDTHESDAARPSPLDDPPPRSLPFDDLPPLPLDDLPPRPRTPASTRAGGGDRRGGGPRIRLIVGGVVGVLVVGVVLVLLLGGGSDKPPAGNRLQGATPPPAASKPPSAATKVDRKATQVAVLNGTTQTGLARNVGKTIQDDGFTLLKVGDNADQQIASTTISYADGKEAAARAVAQIMEVPVSAVQPIDPNTKAVVDAAADVVVIVGNDKSSTG